jgi:hypothetical protein
VGLHPEAPIRTSGKHVFDYVKFGVRDDAASKASFLKALETLGVGALRMGASQIKATAGDGVTPLFENRSMSRPFGRSGSRRGGERWA